MGKFIISEDEKRRILNLYENNQAIQPSQFVKDMATGLALNQQSLMFLDFESINKKNGTGTDGFNKTIADLRTIYSDFPSDPKKATNYMLNKTQTLSQEVVNKIKQNPTYITNISNFLNSYRGSMTQTQKNFVDATKSAIQSLSLAQSKNISNNITNSLNQTQNRGTENIFSLPMWNTQNRSTVTPSQSATTAQTQSATTAQTQSVTTTETTQPGDKINTTNDKAYDYKLSGGKYYFKGKPNTPSATKYTNWTEATGKGLEAIKSKVSF